MEPSLALIHLLDALSPEYFGQGQVAPVDQLVDEVHQYLKHFVCTVAQTIVDGIEERTGMRFEGLCQHISRTTDRQTMKR